MTNDSWTLGGAGARDLQTRSGWSVKKIVRTLRPLQHVTIRPAGQLLDAGPAIPDDAAELLRALGAQLPVLASGEHTLSIQGQDAEWRLVGKDIPLRVGGGFPLGVALALGVLAISTGCLLVIMLRYRGVNRVNPAAGEST